jgi:hypothetical protein
VDDLDEEPRREAMPRVACMVKSPGVMIMSLRHGPVAPPRRMFEVSAEETISLAASVGLRSILNLRASSVQTANRAAGVTWTRLAFERA